VTAEHLTAILAAIGIVSQPFFLAYFLLYNGYMLMLIALSARQVRRREQQSQGEPPVLAERAARV